MSLIEGPLSLLDYARQAVCALSYIHNMLLRGCLLSHDRVKADELIMTQELIADMLGVRSRLR